MKVIGFCPHHKEWLPVEVEVSFIPGLPQIHLIGQADRNLKESLIKIKSILRSLEVDVPKSKQLVVNLRGGDFRKKSLGLELPIVLAILVALKTINLDGVVRAEGAVRTVGTDGLVSTGASDIVYAHGELSLEGQIHSSDLFLLKSIVSDKVTITGLCKDGILNEKHVQFQHIKDLISCYLDISDVVSDVKDRPIRFTGKSAEPSLIRPLLAFDPLVGRTLRPEFEKDPEHVFFTQGERDLLLLVSLGRHSLLLMGPRGLGKSTLAESLNYLAEPPDEETFLHQSKYFYVEEGAYWRPFVRPHHSISHLALVGGGPQCQPGEITRAHGGILLLDEFLEFDPKCQEALREPMQNKTIHLARGQRYQKYDCDFHFIATTNLCSCGQWLPGKAVDCAYSYARCRKYRDKLSGPVIDRFHILSFLRPRKKIEQCWTLASVYQEVERHRVNFKQRRERVVFKKDLLSLGLRQRLDHELNSLRRLNASIEVAKTLCTIKNQTQVTDEIMIEALAYTWQPFLDLME
ncbi:MAG: ATP-binding protein [Bdellovibrionaceae bacterium]|nr:ATP-binding protein [Pseudobdellovibrionaceae bacterium]